jgi:hypothetical protein
MCLPEDYKRKIKHLAKLRGDSVLTSFGELVSTWYALVSRIEGFVKLQFQPPHTCKIAMEKNTAEMFDIVRTLITSVRCIVDTSHPRVTELIATHVDVETREHERQLYNTHLLIIMGFGILNPRLSGSRSRSNLRGLKSRPGQSCHTRLSRNHMLQHSTALVRTV